MEKCQLFTRWNIICLKSVNIEEIKGTMYCKVL